MSAPSSIADALPSELLARIRAIHIRTKRLVTDALAGEYQSAFKGRGMEFEETRAYVPGDDIRHIDWKVTARTTEASREGPPRGARTDRDAHGRRQLVW